MAQRKDDAWRSNNKRRMNGTLGNRCAYTGSFIYAYTTVTFIYSTLFASVALAAIAVTYD